MICINTRFLWPTYDKNHPIKKKSLLKKNLLQVSVVSRQIKIFSSVNFQIDGFGQRYCWNEHFSNNIDVILLEHTKRFCIWFRDHLNWNKNYYVVRNAGCAQSRYILKLSLIFLIDEWFNQSINRVYLERLIRR